MNNDWLKTFFWKLTVGFTYTVKNLFDFFFSLLLLILLLPLFLVIAIIIRIDSRGGIFFTQIRIGRNGKKFTLYKFRSMIADAESMKKTISAGNESADGVTFKMRQDPRITRFGSFIRKFSIDELPQLFNVVKGDMSLVGPRPSIPEEVAEYSEDDKKRLQIKPGITCLWQVSGRSDLPFKQQVELDKEYIKSKSIILDIKILLKTIPAVLTGKGAY